MAIDLFIIITIAAMVSMTSYLRHLSLPVATLFIMRYPVVRKLNQHVSDLAVSNTKMYYCY